MNKIIGADSGQKTLISAKSKNGSDSSQYLGKLFTESKNNVAKKSPMKFDTLEEIEEEKEEI